jgi:glyceraldehyde-3-phosphate dehydrogenase/erythrose-4-phosphate dehydrogenase
MGGRNKALIATIPNEASANPNEASANPAQNPLLEKAKNAIKEVMGNSGEVSVRLPQLDGSTASVNVTNAVSDKVDDISEAVSQERQRSPHNTLLVVTTNSTDSTSRQELDEASKMLDETGKKLSDLRVQFKMIYWPDPPVGASSN